MSNSFNSWCPNFEMSYNEHWKWAQPITSTQFPVPIMCRISNNQENASDQVIVKIMQWPYAVVQWHN